jgi:hypothetical protein
MKISTQFWNTYGGQLLVGSNNRIAFTAAGRRALAPRLARQGRVLANIKTLPGFLDVMSEVGAEELEANTRKFEALLHSPQTSAEERALIRRLLGFAESAA